MKNFLKALTIFCLLFNTYSQAQNTSFEGKVYYRHFVELKDTTKSEWDIIMFYGSESNLYIKDGQYRWDFVNSALEQEIYVSEENKVYSKYQKNDTLYWEHANEPAEEILQTFPIKENNTEIMGKMCDLLMIKSKLMGSQEIRGRMYYFSDDYPLDPKHFTQLKVNNQNVIYDKMQAIPLQIIVLHKEYRVIYKAFGVEEKTLDAQLFKLDKSKPRKSL